MDYAGFWKRVGAWIIDAVLTGFVGFVQGIVVAIMGVGMQWSQDTAIIVAQVFALIFGWPAAESAVWHVRAHRELLTRHAIADTHGRRPVATVHTK